MQDGHYLSLREAVEKLTHPYRIPFSLGQFASVVEHVSGIIGNAFCPRLTRDVLSHHANLAREVYDGYVNAGRMGHATQRKATRIATNVHQMARVIGENDVQSLVERVVAIKVVEPEPAFLHLFGQFRKTLVDGGPIAKGFQSFGLFVLQSLF